ncbi:MAG: AAA family ATPase [Lachnospiraceae bacterium]|nr:AAA family ATPase [Lachnospiraceae bacterium]
MGYTFRNICIRNFKYITDEKPLEFEFSNSNIVILDGQNGYGKTTLFDAIEILLTGRIKHFNPNLQNRKTETIGMLANNGSKDIVIAAVLSSDTEGELRIERRLLCKDEFKSILLLNDQQTEQEELYDKLGFSLNMFDIGMYISQSESLEFLQNKYKDRKAYVSSLLDNSEMQDKIKTLKSIQESLEERINQETEEKEGKIKSAKDKVASLEKQMESVSIHAELPGEDVRLFSEEEYPFDVIEINEDVTYDSVILPLRQVSKFVENYEEYIKYIDNAYVKELTGTSKQIYMALFYCEEITLLNENENLLQRLNKYIGLLKDFSESKWSVDEKLFEEINIDRKTIDRLRELLLNQQRERSQLADADKVLAQMIKARRAFIDQYNYAVEAGKFNQNKCPLCGTDFEDINQAITETEGFIKNIHTDGVKAIEDYEIEISGIFRQNVIPILQKHLEDNKLILQMRDSLLGCRALSTEKLQKLLAKLGISGFSSNRKEEFNMDEFSREYEKLMETIRSKEIPNKIILKDEEIELYKSIHNKYYHNKKPVHTLEELHSKEQYIAKLFNDKFSLQLSVEKEKLKKLEEDYGKYGTKRDAMLEAFKTLVSKYEASSKDYQTQLTNAIKIPLLVYSGRIIQNYPLGLGIRAVVKTNQLVFEATSKNGNDVYNILSTGQLNGLSIAFLLSIKNVYGQADGLDILLIDDPLQTIDDISAISLADLLTQQGIGQIVLSTHEDAKAALLRYKFKKAGLSVLEKNMQKLYMETVSVEG